MGLYKRELNSHKGEAKGAWWLPIFVLVASTLILFGGDLAREYLRFDRAGIGDGEVWRLLSGHFVHLGWSHFALNAAGLVLVWFLVGDVFGMLRWALIALITIAAMGLGFWILNPELEWYVGLSGLLHGVLAAGLVASLGNAGKETLALIVLVVAKLAWEQLSGPLPGSEGSSGGPVIVDAHLYGTIGGVLAALPAIVRVRPAASI